MALAVEWKTHCWFVYWEISGKCKNETKYRFNDYPLDRTSFTCAAYNYHLTSSDNMDYLSLTLNFNEKGV